MKTIKQIADALEMDKQRVYRYIRKNHINEAHQKDGVMWYDEAAETAILQHFTGKYRINEAHHTTSNDTVIDTVITMLQQELIAKNRLISEQQQAIHELTAAMENTAASLQAAQALHAGTMQKHLTDGRSDLAEPDTPPSSTANFLTRIFKSKKK